MKDLTIRKYWNKLKQRLKAEGSQSVTNCHQLKLEAADGKSYLTDVADPETLLRLIQSVPSPKAEPAKSWLAKVGYERMQDMADPARSLDGPDIYMDAEVKDDINRKAEESEPLPDLITNAYYLLGKDWLETRKSWEEAGHTIPPVMITVANRTETAARINEQGGFGVWESAVSYGPGDLEGIIRK